MALRCIASITGRDIVCCASMEEEATRTTDANLDCALVKNTHFKTILDSEKITEIIE